MQYSTMYIMLRSKVQIEKIEDPAIGTNLDIFKSLSVTNKEAWFLFRTF